MIKCWREGYLGSCPKERRSSRETGLHLETPHQKGGRAGLPAARPVARSPCALSAGAAVSSRKVRAAGPLLSERGSFKGKPALQRGLQWGAEGRCREETGSRKRQGFCARPASQGSSDCRARKAQGGSWPESRSPLDSHAVSWRRAGSRGVEGTLRTHSDGFAREAGEAKGAVNATGRAYRGWPPGF